MAVKILSGVRGVDQYQHICDLDGCGYSETLTSVDAHPSGWFLIEPGARGHFGGEFCCLEHAEEYAKGHLIDPALIRPV